MSRSFLSLQGVASPFFSELGRQLRQMGHRTHRVNFCGGDLMCSWFEEHTNFIGKPDVLGDWLTQLLGQHQITDVLLFGDCRPVHRTAIEVFTRQRVRVYVFEEGYLRPDWITLEMGGVNGYSGIPTNPNAMLEWSAQLGAVDLSMPAAGKNRGLAHRARWDITYRLMNSLFCWLFPHYRSHRPHNGLIEYAGLARRFLLEHWFRKEAQTITNSLLATDIPYFLFPLQLNADFQIRTHSQFPDVLTAIDEVLTSFATNKVSRGSTPVQLLVKNHPLDTGLARYRSFTVRRARELGISNRVKFVEAGDLPLLLEHALGVVLVNSTVGLTALALNCPVYAMGKAIFNMSGLTFQSNLEAFWQCPTPPDASFVKVFVDYLKAHSQIGGDFYSPDGIRQAATNSVQRMLNDAP